jgi:hypothetical protein
MAVYEDETQNTQLYTDSSLAKVVTGTDVGAKHALDVNNASSPKKGVFVSRHVFNSGESPTHTMNVDGSSTPVVFSVGPASGKRWYITRLIMVLEDVAMNWNKFGGITALTNGVSIDYDDTGSNINLLDIHDIKTNQQFTHWAYDAEINSGSTDVLRVRWTFDKSGTALQMNNANSDTFNITVNDDLTGLITFIGVIQGYEVDE